MSKVKISTVGRHYVCNYFLVTDSTRTTVKFCSAWPVSDS